jgi:hypothetical protein
VVASKTRSHGLSAAAIEVNQTFNFCNEASWLAITRTEARRLSPLAHSDDFDAECKYAAAGVAPIHRLAFSADYELEVLRPCPAT